MATLGEQAVGSIVKLNVNGTPWNFIVVQQGLPSTMYGSSCDGTWLLMQDIYITMAYVNSATGNDYAKSKINAYLNTDFIALLDSNVRDAIKQAKIPYRPGAGTGSDVASGADGLAVHVFLLSGRETGVTSSQLPEDGKMLEYFVGASNSKRIAYLNGTATAWWLRTPNYRYNTVACISVSGSHVSHATNQTASYGIRPALILPYNAIVTDGLVDGTIVAASKAITGNVTIGGVQRELTGAGYINIGGVLRDLSDSQVNIGSILKSLKG